MSPKDSIVHDYTIQVKALSQLTIASVMIDRRPQATCLNNHTILRHVLSGDGGFVALSRWSMTVVRAEFEQTIA